MDEACRTCGTAGEILASIVEDPEVFKCLKAQPQRVTGFDVPIPFSPPMEQFVLPDAEKIAVAVNAVMNDG